jgi:hypothetical protein
MLAIALLTPRKVVLLFRIKHPKIVLLDNRT